MTRSLMRPLAALFALALVAAACGDSDDDSSDGTEAPATTAAAADAGGGEEAAADDRSDWPDTLTFGAVPAENAQEISDYVTPQIIADELGVGVEFFQAADYAGVIEGMIAERVDIGSFGAFSYVIATGNGADIDVVGLWSGETPDTLGDYRSYGITQADNDDVTSIEDFAGRRVCFVDPGSTSGFLFPSEGLLSLGIDPTETSTDIEAIFAGGHDASAISVANGDCEVGFAYDTMVTEQLIDSGDIAGVVDTVEDEDVNPDSAELKIVWKSLPIAAPPLAAGNWLPESMLAEIEEIVTTKVNVDWAVENGYCESAEDCPLSDGPFWGYLEGDDSYFDGIRQLCEVTGAAQCDG